MATSPQLENIIAVLRSRPTPANLSWEDRRAGMEAMQANLHLPEDVACDPSSVGSVPVEWISSPSVSPDRVVLYLHGGGYTIGSISTHRVLMESIGRAAGARVLAVDYRLAPENPFPAAIEDAVACWRFLLERGLDASNCAIAGDSAGGGLTLATLLELRRESLPLPGAVALLSPWTDLTGSGDSVISRAELDPMVTAAGLHMMARAYAGDTDPADPLVSPLFADLEGLPPLLIQVGTSEILLDDSSRLAERARVAGVEVQYEEWEDMLHVFQFLPSLAESGRAIEGIGSFIRDCAAS